MQFQKPLPPNNICASTSYILARSRSLYSLLENNCTPHPCSLADIANFLSITSTDRVFVDQPTRTTRIDSPESDDSLRGRDSPLRPVPAPLHPLIRAEQPAGPPRHSSSVVLPVPDSTALPQLRSSCWCPRPRRARPHHLQPAILVLVVPGAIYQPSSRPLWLPTAPRRPGALPYDLFPKIAPGQCVAVAYPGLTAQHGRTR